MLEGCAECRLVAAHTTSFPTNRDHICQRVDSQMLELIGEELKRKPTLDEAIRIHETIQGNLLGAQALMHDQLPPSFEPFLDLLRKVHARLLLGTGLSFGGRIRTTGSKFGFGPNEQRAVAPSEILPELEKHFERMTRRWGMPAPIGSVASGAGEHLYRFLQIHPFKDLNGRVARILFAAHIRSTGVFECRTFREDDRDTYLNALKEVDARIREDDWREQGETFYTPIARWAESYIHPIEASEDTE